MSELKTVVVLDGQIINVGEMEDMPIGATIEQREMVYSIEKGWQLTNATQAPSQEDVLTAKIQLEALNLLIELGVI